MRCLSTFLCDGRARPGKERLGGYVGVDFIRKMLIRRPTSSADSGVWKEL